MKRIILIITMLSSIITIHSQQAAYTVTATIEGAEGVVFLLQSATGSTYTYGSGVVKNGTIVIKGGSVDYPQYVNLTTTDKKSRLSFFLENSNITINGKLSYLTDAEVKGSKTQDEYKQLSDLIFPVSKQYVAVMKEQENARKAGNTALADEKTRQINDLGSQVKKIQIEFIRNHPASFVVPFLLRGLSYELGGGEIESIIRGLDPDVAKTPVITELKARAEVLKKVDIGQKAPDFTLNDPSGKPVSLYSLTGKNYLLIDFWAAWCGPCRAENPNVVKVYNEFRNKGFDILGVSLDRSAADWNKAIADDKLAWTHVSDLQYWNSAAAKLYAIGSIPANLLLDRNGIIIAKNLRGEQLHIKIKELLDNK